MKAEKGGWVPHSDLLMCLTYAVQTALSKIPEPFQTPDSLSTRAQSLGLTPLFWRTRTSVYPHPGGQAALGLHSSCPCPLFPTGQVPSGNLRAGEIDFKATGQVRVQLSLLLTA